LVQFPRQFAPWFNGERRGQTETDVELNKPATSCVFVLVSSYRSLPATVRAGGRTVAGDQFNSTNATDGRVANTLCRTASRSRHYWIRSWVQSWATNENGDDGSFLWLGGHWKGADGSTNSHAESCDCKEPEAIGKLQERWKH